MLSAVSSSKNIYKSLLTFVVAALLSACGGGGGGDSGPSYPNITYSGIETEAVIDQTNADEFPLVMLEGGSGSTSIPLAVNVEAGTAEGIPNKENVKKASAVISSLITSNLGNNADQVTGASQSLTGNCGGTATVTENSSSSSFSGSMQFDNYCEIDTFGYQLSMHGLISFSGNYNLDASNSPVLTSLSLTIQYLKITFNDGSTTVSEEFSGNLSVTSFDPVTNEPLDFTITVNYVYQGQVFKIANLQVDEFGGAISGTLYHPDHGYVVITTNVAFTYDTVTEQFCGGTLHIVGSDGTATNNALIEFTADATCSAYNICVTINTNPQVCSYGNAWGTEPVWP